MIGLIEYYDDILGAYMPAIPAIVIIIDRDSYHTGLPPHPPAHYPHSSHDEFETYHQRKHLQQVGYPETARPISTAESPIPNSTPHQLSGKHLRVVCQKPTEQQHNSFPITMKTLRGTAGRSLPTPIPGMSTYRLGRRDRGVHCTVQFYLVVGQRGGRIDRDKLAMAIYR